MPGDGPKVKTLMKHDKGLTVIADVPVPALGDKQVYWIRPVITNGKGETHWVTATSIAPSLPLERKVAMLAFKPPANMRFAAELSSQGGFKLRNEDGRGALGVHRLPRGSHRAIRQAGRSIPVRVGYNRLALNISMDGKPLRVTRRSPRRSRTLRCWAQTWNSTPTAGWAPRRPTCRECPNCRNRC